MRPDYLKAVMWENMTVGRFLKKCLLGLIKEGEGFSGKRPLGESDWDWVLKKALEKEVRVELTWSQVNEILKAELDRLFDQY